ncbi:hypothetical protein DXV75_05230 [Alteromonas aestuariivivens]|uniref:DUF4231 domain-containing protein n=1 Tax=Alteromonas aestuariivivens TaxID=1938339 RepID=A0A3D8MBI6_9ALTE|nr:hypothetical protein [Alteromonas aestuariivivens]RDV27435.1 hypothetical protein DXV75_05230 [Alteromonas aestuariivivens]
MSNNSPIMKEIKREICKRYWYARFDFIFNHLLLLIMVVASSYPAFAQIFSQGNEKYTAAIAAIPAFILLFQRTFKWEQRGEWHWEYHRRLIALSREVRDQNLPLQQASIKLTLLEQEFAGTFPGVNYSAGKEPKT